MSSQNKGGGGGPRRLPQGGSTVIANVEAHREETSLHLEKVSRHMESEPAWELSMRFSCGVIELAANLDRDATTALLEALVDRENCDQFPGEVRVFSHTFESRSPGSAALVDDTLLVSTRDVTVSIDLDDDRREELIEAARGTLRFPSRPP
jgi:hypothetical protein